MSSCLIKLLTLKGLKNFFPKNLLYKIKIKLLK